MIRDALKDFLGYLPARVLPGLVAVAAVPALTRLLSPSDYGRYVMALNAAALFSALASSWVTASAVRFIPGYEQRGRLAHGLALLVALYLPALGAGMLLTAASGLVVAWRQMLPGGLIALTVALCAASATHDFLLGLLRSRRRVRAFTALSAATGIGGFTLAIVLATLVEPSSQVVVAGFLAAVLVVGPFTARLALRGARAPLPSLRSSEAREMLRYGLPAVVISGLTWVTSLSDRYIIAAAEGTHAVGIYAASRDLSDKVLVLVNTLIMLAATPVGMSVWERHGEEAARDYVADLTRYYLMIAAPLAAGMSVLARPLIAFLADTPYHDGYRLVPLVAGGALLAGLAARYAIGLHFRRRTDLLSLCYIGAAAANVGLNLVLVPMFGYIAAAAANLAAFLLLLLVTRAVSRPLFTWAFPLDAAWRIAGATATMAGVVWLATRGIARPGLQLAIGVPLGVIIYAGAVFGTGALKPGEQATLARVFRSRGTDQPPSVD